MSALLAGYESSGDEYVPGPSTKPEVAAIEDDGEESDDEKLEAQARADAFGLTGTNGSTSQAKRANGKMVVASAPDVLKEVGVVLWIV